MAEEKDDTPIIDVTAEPSAGGGRGYIPRDDIWSFLRRRKGTLGLCWLIGSIGAMIWVMWRPNWYEAESRVMISRIGSPSPITEAEMASELELVRDPGHLNKIVLDELKTASDARILERRTEIDRNLNAGPAGKSNILAIQYRDMDSARAAKIANQVVDLYLAERRVVFQPGAGVADPQAATANGPIFDSLMNFDVRNRGPQLEKALEARTQHSIDLEGRVAELQGSIRDTQETANALRKKLASLPERVRTQTRASISTSTPSLLEQTESLNPLKQQIESDVVKKDAEVAGLKARLEQMQLALRQSKAVEDQLSTLASERLRLERKVEEAQAKNTLSKGESAERPVAGTLRATLLNHAGPPMSPLPKYNWLWIPAAVFAALFWAFLIAWFIDWFDRPIYTADEFEHASGAPPIDPFSNGANH